MIWIICRPSTKKTHIGKRKLIWKTAPISIIVYVCTRVSTIFNLVTLLCLLGSSILQMPFVLTRKWKWKPGKGVGEEVGIHIEEILLAEVKVLSACLIYFIFSHICTKETWRKPRRERRQICSSWTAPRLSASEKSSFVTFAFKSDFYSCNDLFLCEKKPPGIGAPPRILIRGGVQGDPGNDFAWKMILNLI